MKKMSNKVYKYKKLNYLYSVEKTYEAGIILEPWEIPSIREHGISLNESYIAFNSKGRLVIYNSYIQPQKEKLRKNDNLLEKSKRNRELLLHKKEIVNIKSLLREKSLTAIPAKIYKVGSLYKVEVAICKGKRNYDKRQALKEQDIKRDLDRQMK